MAKGNYKELDLESYYITYKWMSLLELAPKEGCKKTSKRKLAGLNKEIYAIIYGFSSSGEKSCYYSYSQFEEITGSTRKAVSMALKELEANDFISVEREKRGSAYEKTFYKVNLAKIPISQSWIVNTFLDNFFKVSKSVFFRCQITE